MKKAGGLCEICAAKGIITAAEIVHHRVPLTAENINDPSVTLNWTSLCAVCRQCHADLHGRPRRYQVDKLGRVIAKD
jgi:predicted HNH restriction endonuclease